MDLQQVTPDLWVQNEAQYLEGLKNNFQWNSVPLLNANDLHNLQDNRLVRFRGMVQDMFNPEYYLEKYEVVDKTTQERSMRNGKLTYSWCKDSEEINQFSCNNVTSDRQTLVMISMPCLNDWAEKIEKEHNKLQLNGQASSPSMSKKRLLELEEGQMETESVDLPEAPTSGGGDTKRCVPQTSKSSSGESPIVVTQEDLLNFPVPERLGKACHAVVYEVTDQIKLNDMLEIVGFLSVDPLLTDINHEDEYGNKREIQVHNPPPSLVPRVHCVMWKKIEHNNPLVDGNRFSVEKIQSLKKELHLLLTQLLCGDALAAEYLILHLISRVYIRRDLLPLGKLPLNISNVPVEHIPQYGKQLYKFIELLVPKSHYFPLTLENLNKTAFIPEKDYECDRVTSGLLQLSNNTHLVLDETLLNAGSVSAAGVYGLDAIAKTITNQKTSYNFKYYPMEFDCDIAFLILSISKCMLPADFHVELQLDQTCVSTFGEILDAAKHFLKPELLNDLRVYLTLARHGEYEVTEGIQQAIQNEFVEMRQKDQAMGATDLHQLLVLARLVCLSEGKTNLDAACWRRACELELERKGRL